MLGKYKPNQNMHKKKRKNFRFSSLVAGVGIEPHDLRVMSPTSYQLLYPAILDCKYTDIFSNCKFYLQKMQKNYIFVKFLHFLLIMLLEITPPS